MNHALILCRSVTQAQRLGRLLASRGIANRMFRAPVGLTDRGCSYAVRLREETLADTLLLMKQHGIRPMKVLRQNWDDSYDEVAWQ